MNLADYKKSLKNPLRLRTIVFLMKDKQILLGYKKTGFGKGNYVGIGGKVHKKEDPMEAAKREVREEILVTLTHIDQIGMLDFYFPHIKDESWNQRVSVYTASVWNGTPKETSEIKPVWFDQNLIPYPLMWDDARYWIPGMLTGNSFMTEFLFDSNLKVLEYNNLK